MLTLQIRDREQTFFHALEGQPVVVGSGDGVDLRLQADGVNARHLRIEFAGGVAQLIALGGAGVIVNGRSVRRAPLQLGDRIEVGQAVLVVGQSIVRKAEAEDVLAAAPVNAAAWPRAPLGRGRRRGAVLPLGAAVLLAAGVLWVIASGYGRTPAGFAEIERLARAGSFALAQGQIDELRANWAAGDPEREQRIAAAAARVEALAAAVATCQQQVRALASERTDAELRFLLERRAAEDADEDARLAAGIVRSSLADVVRGAARRPAPDPAKADAAVAASVPPAADPAPVPPAAIADSAPARGAAPKTDETAPSTGTATAASEIPALLQDVDRLAGQRLFGQALDVLQAACAGAGGEDQDPLRRRLVELTAAARRECDALIATARATAAQGRLAEAVAQLDDAQHRFPSGAGFAGLPAAMAEMQQRLASADRARPVARAAPAVDEATRRVTLDQLHEQLDRIRAAETDGDFAAAARLLAESALLVRERDTEFAARMQRRAAEFTLLAELHDATAALLGKGQRFEVLLRSGGMASLHGSDGCRLLVSGPLGEQRITWLDLAASAVARIVEEGKLGGHAVLGAAALLYRNGESGEAESLLARAVKADPTSKPDVDRALAAGRGEEPDPRGYTLGKDGFVSARALDADKEAQKLLARLDGVLRGRDKKAREQFTAEVMARPPASLPAIASAFKQQLRKQVEQIEHSSAKKQVERLLAQREQLDTARAFAKELIYDEVRYFYPYKPPQVSGERYAEYLRVQAEVDRRVDAVRALWGDERLKVRVPAKLQEDLERLDWVASVLADLGELDAEALAAVEWARALPPGDAVTIRSFCRTAQEREELQQWQAIDAWNDKLSKTEKGIAVVEFELLRITNDYRELFRHRPLALNSKIRSASRGHAEEMAKLGYFSHFSPTPGHRTPFDRMKLAGYDFGVSENIALADSALSAHAAWTHSSGHHRNLLNPAHTEFGIGATSRYWVQNFGAGKDWCEHAHGGGDGRR